MSDLNRMRKLAGILTESVVSVPGMGKQEQPNEVDQMFDESSLSGVDPQLDENLNPSEEELINKYRSGEINREEFMQQMDSIAYTDNSMRQGEMGMMGSDTPAGHRAWDREKNDWEYDAQDGGSTDERGDAMDGWDGEDDEFDESGPGMEESSSTPGMLEEGALKEVIQQKIQRARELQDSMVDPDEVSDMIAAELEQEGFDEQEILNIIDAVADGLSDDTVEDNDEDEYDDTCPTCTGTGEGMYDGASCRACGGSGVLKGEGDPDDFDEPYDYPDDDYMGPLEEASKDDIDDEDELEEAYDLNNGYTDVKYSKGSDYFPTGADSPVTRSAGPSGARQGDNPEQKKMEVTEAHKDLVYNYRKFLKESVKITELSKGTLKSYSKGRGETIHADQRDSQDANKMSAEAGAHGDSKKSAKWDDEASWLHNRAEKGAKNVAKATTKIAKKP